MNLPRQFYYKRNRFQQLRGFCYTIQTGSMSKAAKKIGLSQSAITLQIQSLERDLGVKLFNRKTTKIEVTKEGKDLYSYCISYIYQTDNLFENFLKSLEYEKSKIVNIASNHVGISYILPKYIKKFKDIHADVKFQIRNLSRIDCKSRILEDDIDMFIYPINSGEILDDLEFIPIVKYQPILLVKKGHTLAKKEKVILKDIAKFELVRIDPKLITLPAFEELLKVNKIKSTIEFEMSDWEILKKFVKADIGVAMISNIILEGEKEDDLVERVLTDYFPEMTYGVFLKKGKKLRGLSKEFLNLIINQKLLSAQIK